MFCPMASSRASNVQILKANENPGSDQPAPLPTCINPFQLIGGWALRVHLEDGLDYKTLFPKRSAGHWGTRMDFSSCCLSHGPGDSSFSSHATCQALGDRTVYLVAIGRGLVASEREPQGFLGYLQVQLPETLLDLHLNLFTPFFIISEKPKDWPAYVPWSYYQEVGI